MHFDSPALYWIRNDQRLRDNPALSAACRHSHIVPLFIWSPDDEDPWVLGGASRWWLHRSLTDLGSAFAKLGSSLCLDSGPIEDVLTKWMQETGAKAIYWNRLYDARSIERDRGLKKSFQEQGCHVESFNGSLINEPWQVHKGDGRPYQVFTPFYRTAVQLRDNLRVLDRPAIPACPKRMPESQNLDRFALNPGLPWDEGLKNIWHPGESGAQRTLQHFVDQLARGYDHTRDVPGVQGTSQLSPYLAFGNVSPRQILQALQPSADHPSVVSYIRQLYWREFAYTNLYYNPNSTHEPIRSDFRKFPWVDTKGTNKKFHLTAWQKGQTGYPIVDAGMRELWTTGWMHNRVRMIVGSFLVKHLRIHWSHGAEWFWDTLVDADLANNTMGWQWVAGCGIDAAPYFRIFNPMLQSRKFDPQGAYLRKWLPELEDLPDKWIHEPWNAPLEVLGQASVKLGTTYPQPVVDHKTARSKALHAFQELKELT